MRKYIIITIILLFSLPSCYANTTVIYGSYPQNTDGLYFSDGQGNSIYMGSTRMIPYIYNSYPSAIWVEAAPNRIPANLVVYQYINGFPVYLCRISLNGNWAYGQLIFNRGCVLQNYEDAFASFQVLIR